MTLRRLLLALLVCGCAPSAAAPTALAPARRDPVACLPLFGTLLDLRALTNAAQLYEREHQAPLAPAQLAEKLDADARKARALPIADPDASGAAREVADLLALLAGKVRTFAEAQTTGRDAEPALRDLHDALKSAAPSVDAIASRCSLSTKPTPGAGRLPPALIQRIIRARFDTLRTCYENGLRVDPTLRAHVSIRFVIDGTGAVRDVVDADRAPPRPQDWGKPRAASSISDAGVSACVVEAFKQIAFPPPDGGNVTVTYPIQFSPGG